MEGFNKFCESVTGKTKAPDYANWHMGQPARLLDLLLRTAQNDRGLDLTYCKDKLVCLVLNDELIRHDHRAFIHVNVYEGEADSFSIIRHCSAL